MGTRKTKHQKQKSLHHVRIRDEKTPEKQAGKPPIPSLLPGSRLRNAGIFLLLVLGTLALYSPALHFGFFRIDDQQYVVNNPWIREFSAENIRYILTTPYFVNYSPLHLFSYMADYMFNGADPYVFHLSSNIWAGIVAGFVFLTALAFTRNHAIAIPAAVLFVLHPAHVEAVAWISSRKDLVAAAFALPSLLAYMKYRQGGPKSRAWYAASVLLFLFALAGKLSVATFPAIFLAMDLFIEKREFRRSLADKIPFLAMGILMALVVASAQPPTGARPDAWVLFISLLRNFWLITGLGDYVIYRTPAQPLGIAYTLAGLALLAAIFIVPYLLRRYYPLATVMLYWIIFAFIPTQVLSFAYPVSDRYLFFPSVAAVILVAHGLYKGITGLKKISAYTVYIPLLALAILWGAGTVRYLNEWKDPRSVWYGALKKSPDPLVYYNLGWHYMDQAARFGEQPRRPRLGNEEAIELARAVWQDHATLPALVAELQSGNHQGSNSVRLRDYLRILAHTHFETAVSLKGKHIMPDFLFHRGMLFLDMGRLADARNSFMAALEETERSGYAEGSREVRVNVHYNLGIISWMEADYRQALEWMRLAAQEQLEFGGDWFPEVHDHIRRLEQILLTLSGGTEK